MNRRVWSIVAGIVSGTLLICTFGTWWLWHELDSWAIATPQNGVRIRTERLLAAAQARPTGSLPTQFQTDSIDPNCWSFLQTTMAAHQPQPQIAVTENGKPAYRDDDLSVIIRFQDGRAVRLFYLVGRIMDCRMELSATSFFSIDTLLPASAPL